MPTIVRGILELLNAAAFAAWAGGLAYAFCRPALRSPAWHHVGAASAAVGAAAFTFFAALVALGHGASLSGREGVFPSWGGLLVLAAVVAVGAGAPWGLWRHAAALRARAAGEDDDAPPEVLPLARRTAATLFLPLAALGLLTLSSRVARNEAAADVVGTLLLSVTLLVTLGAATVAAARHLRPILKLAGWGALAGVPAIAALMVYHGAAVGTALLFAAASAVVWAPLFGFLVWGLTGMEEAGYHVDRLGHVVPRGWPSSFGSGREAESPPRRRSPAPRRRPRRGRKR